MDELRSWLHDAEDDGDPAWDVEQWAEYFDASNKCEICGSRLVEVDTLAQKLVKHFDLRGQEADRAHVKIRSVLARSGVEDSNGGGICGHCHYMMSKD